VWFRFENCLNIDRPRYIHDSKFCTWRRCLYHLKKISVSYYFKLFSTDFGSTQLFCTIRLADHGTKPGTSIQCKTKGSSCEDWAARITLKIRTELWRWQLEPLVLHCMEVPGFVPWSASLIVQNSWVLPKSVENTIVSQLLNLFHCSIYATLFLWVYSILMQVKTLFITLVSCMLLKWTVKRFELQFQKC
jgi:hypothetical protein